MIITRRSIKYLFTYLYRGAQRALNNDRAISSALETQNNDRVHQQDGNHIVWLDMEMTGLDVEKCHILEIACLITDEHLNSVSDCLNLVIHQPNEILENMSDWCKVQHKKTGLIDDCQSSKITLEDARRITLRHLEKHVPKGICPLAGNSVYMDRMFLRKYMPLVNDYLHYRIIDVSTIKELTRRWQPNVHKAAPKKKYSHRAELDIKDSINELCYYREHLFVPK